MQAHCWIASGFCNGCPGDYLRSEREPPWHQGVHLGSQATTSRLSLIPQIYALSRGHHAPFYRDGIWPGEAPQALRTCHAAAVYVFFVCSVFFSDFWRSVFLASALQSRIITDNKGQRKKSWNKRLLKHDWFDIMEAGHISEIYSIAGMKRHVHAPWK